MKIGTSVDTSHRITTAQRKVAPKGKAAILARRFREPAVPTSTTSAARSGSNVIRTTGDNGTHHIRVSVASKHKSQPRSSIARRGSSSWLVLQPAILSNRQLSYGLSFEIDAPS